MWFKASGMPIEYIYTNAAEKYSDVAIDTIKMQMTPPAEGAQADPMMNQQMQMMAVMYGPDMTFRMAAPNDKQMLFTMGGRAEQMERAINVAQGRGTVLANEATLKQGLANLPANRFAEFHLDVKQIMPMVMMMAAMSGSGQPGAAPPAAANDAPPVSFSTSAEASTFRADMVMPSASVKVLVDSLAPMLFRQQHIIEDSEPPGDEF